MCHHRADQVDERTWVSRGKVGQEHQWLSFLNTAVANRMVCQGPRSVMGLREQVPDLRASAWMPGSGRESRALVSRSYEPCYGWEEGSRISMMKS
jgi:hypothetical protein